MTGRGVGKSHHLSTGTQTFIDDEHKYSRACLLLCEASSVFPPVCVCVCVCVVRHSD